MRIAIIALVLSLAALGLGSFATVRTFNESHPAPPAVEASWSEAGCDNARIDVEQDGILWRACRLYPHDCTAYADMLQAIAANCP